jgi:hypothetical protein
VSVTPSGESPPPETIGFPATVVDSEFGGRYMDVSLDAGLTTRVHARIPAGERGGWARTLNAGQPVLARLRPRDLALYDDAGALISRTGRPTAVAS